MRKNLKFQLITAVIVIVLFPGMSKIIEAAPVGKSVLISSLNLRNQLLFLRNGDIWAYDIENRAEIQLTHDKNITNYSISSDAMKIAYFKNLKKLYVFDMKTGSQEFIAEASTDASQPSFSPHGDKIAFIGLTKDKVQVRFSYFTKPVNQKIRHIWIVDVKTKSIVDVTSDIPFQHSQVHWSPDGRWLSFASFRFGTFDLLNPFSNNNWKVYLMDLSDPNHKTFEIADGISSVWLNESEVVFSAGVAANVLTIYDVKSKAKKPYSLFQAGFSSPIFSFGGLNNEIVYYEVILNAEGDGLIRSYNIQSNKTADVIKDASVPCYVK